MTAEQSTTNQITWQTRVPIFKNSVILKQLGFAVGIPFGILLIVLLFAKAYYGLIIVGATFFLAFLLVLIIFRGTYDVDYILNQKGVLCRNQTVQKERVKKLSAVTFWMGLFSRNYTAAGTGALAGASTEVKIPWKRIRKVKFHDSKMTVMLFAGFGETVALFCTAENYLFVKQMIQVKVNK